MGVARRALIGSQCVLGVLLLLSCVVAEQERPLHQIGSAEGSNSAYTGAIQDASSVQLHQAWPLRLQSSAAQNPSGPEASLQQCPAWEHSLCGAVPINLILVVHNLNQCAADDGLQSTEQLQAGVNDSALTPGPAGLVGSQQQAGETEQLPEQPAEGPVDIEIEDSHNFASSKDGAKVVAANKEARKASALLDSDSDTFLKNECRADKWVIIELSQVAKVYVVELAQFELYSSRVKDFVVRGRQSHPRVDSPEYGSALNSSSWKTLGTFTASKVKGSQKFQMQQPSWVKYLQLQFLTHYGSEAVCALNDVRVYGKSAAEDLEDRLALDAAEDEVVPAETGLGVKAAVVVDAVAAGDVPSTAATQQLEGRTDEAVQPIASLQASHQPDLPPGSTGSQRVASEARQAGSAVTGSAVGAATSNSLSSSDPPSVPRPDAAVPANASSHTAVFQGSASPHPSNASQTAPLAEQAGPSGSTVAAQPSTDSTPGPTTTVVPPVADKPDPASDDLLPPVNSASSSKTRAGGSVYDMLIQEIKSLKVLHKGYARQLADVQKELAASVAAVTADVQALSGNLAQLQEQVKPPTQVVPVDRLQTSSAQLAQLAEEVLALKLAASNAAKREVGMFVIVGLLGAIIVLTSSLADRVGRLVKGVVLGLLVANGIAGVLMHAAAYPSFSRPTWMGSYSAPSQAVL